MHVCFGAWSCAPLKPRLHLNRHNAGGVKAHVPVRLLSVLPGIFFLTMVAYLMMFPNRKFLIMAFSMAFTAGLVTGCSEIKKTNEAIDQSMGEATAGLQQLQPKGKISQELAIDNSPYYGSIARPISKGDALPSQFEQDGAIVMTFARPVTMEEFTRMIQSVTGLRANTATSAASASAAGAAAGEATFMPADGEQVSGGRVVWQGRLSDLLDQASDVFRADWRYDGRQITFANQVTRTFMLHALAGELSMTGSVASGGATGSNVPQVNLSTTSGLKIWDDIRDAVATIMGSDGTAAYSQSTGTITVTASPDIVRRVENYLNQQNSMRLRRVAIAVKVLEVRTNDAQTLEHDLTGVIRKAFGETSLRSVGTSTAGLALGILKDPDASSSTNPNNANDLVDIDDDRLISQLRLNKSVEDVSTVHSGALMTLSDQPAPLQVGRQVTYVARTSSTTGDTSSVSIEPGTVDDGLMMTVLPRIVDQNKILMRVSVAIAALQPIQTFGTAPNQIQLPEINTTGFLQNAVMTSGETLVLAGFERGSDSTTNDGAPGVLRVLGGRNNTSREHTVTILMLTSEILPEEPMTVIGEQ